MKQELKMYTKPALKVVELQLRRLLMASKTETSGSPTYNKFNEEETW